jgi:hypothetical protein
MARALVAVVLLAALAGCGGADEPTVLDSTEEAVTGTAPPTTTETRPEPETAPAPGTAPEPAPEALPGLPPELAGYETWPRLNAEPIPPRDPDPHRGTKHVYASVAAEGGVYPDGAIVVKEAVRPDAGFVGLVAMMRKQAGANPEHNDWVMVEWTRESAGEPFAELAAGGVCTSCHAGARATDYVFTQR